MANQMDSVHVYDTWVKGKNGKLHFDVMTTSQEKASSSPSNIWWESVNRTRSSPLRNASSATVNRSSCFRKSSSASSGNRAASSLRCRSDWEE
jgi:hypothetical protein